MTKRQEAGFRPDLCTVLSFVLDFRKDGIGQFSTESLWINIGAFDCGPYLTDETTE